MVTFDPSTTLGPKFLTCDMLKAHGVTVILHRDIWQAVIKKVYFIYQLSWTQACLEGMCMNGTQVPCEVPSLPNTTTRKGWPHSGVYDPYSFRIMM